MPEGVTPLRPPRRSFVGLRCPSGLLPRNVSASAIAGTALTPMINRCGRADRRKKYLGRGPTLSYQAFELLPNNPSCRRGCGCQPVCNAFPGQARTGEEDTPACYAGPMSSLSATRRASTLPPFHRSPHATRKRDLSTRSPSAFAKPSSCVWMSRARRNTLWSSSGSTALPSPHEPDFSVPPHSGETIGPGLLHKILSTSGNCCEGRPPHRALSVGSVAVRPSEPFPHARREPSHGPESHPRFGRRRACELYPVGYNR